MKVLDLFSGIGGFSYGLEMASKDFKTTKFCEIDIFCQKVLKKHWPEAPIHDDIKTLTCSEGEFDIICGGFPCQDISVAGQKKGITNETRSGLWFEYKRIIKEVKPKFVIIENVRNLLNNGFAIVLKDLHEIGYNAEWEIISARSVGACHLRERLWIIAYPNKKGFQGQLQGFAKNENMGGEKVCGCSDGFLCEAPQCITNSNNFRFWQSFASEEKKSEWWTEATSSLRNWWETESSVCRVDDGLSKELDKDRVSRIKALGNSIVPQIVKIIGERINDLNT